MLIEWDPFSSELSQDTDITFLRQCLKIFSIFNKATTKLQAKKYLTIYYLISKVYNIYNRLEIIKEEYNVSKYTLINT